mgnify:FL=1
MIAPDIINGTMRKGTNNLTSTRFNTKTSEITIIKTGKPTTIKSPLLFNVTLLNTTKTA